MLFRSATLAAYLIVLIVRLATSRRLIPYRVGPVYLSLNLLLLCAMAAVITLQIPRWPLIGMALFATVLAVNIAPLLEQFSVGRKNNSKK